MIYLRNRAPVLRCRLLPPPNPLCVCVVQRKKGAHPSRRQSPAIHIPLGGPSNSGGPFATGDTERYFCSTRTRLPRGPSIYVGGASYLLRSLLPQIGDDTSVFFTRSCVIIALCCYYWVVDSLRSSLLETFVIVYSFGCYCRRWRYGLFLWCSDVWDGGYCGLKSGC